MSTINNIYIVILYILTVHTVLYTNQYKASRVSYLPSLLKILHCPLSCAFQACRRLGRSRAAWVKIAVSAVMPPHTWPGKKTLSAAPYRMVYRWRIVVDVR